MSADPADRLVYMANQISQFFASQPGDAAATGVADHLRAFWEPRMRQTLIDWTLAGGQGLHPLGVAAVALLSAARPGAIREVLAQAGERTARSSGDDAG